MFSLIKACYCKELGKRPTDDDSSPIRKRIFLKSYAITRAAGLLNQNICAGWRRSGLWLVNMVKLLISKLLVNLVITTLKTTPLELKVILVEALLEVKTPSNKHLL